MTRYSFILLSGNQDKFLSDIQELGVVDITRSLKPVDEHSSGLLARIESIRKAKSRLGNVTVKGVTHSDTTDPVEVVDRAYNCIEELKSQIAAAQHELKLREMWGEFDPAKVSALTERGYKIRFHKMSHKNFVASGASDLLPLTVVNDDGKETWFISASDEELYTEAIAAQAIIGTSEVPAPAGPASEKAAELSALENALGAAEADFASLGSLAPVLDAELAKTESELDLYLAGAVSEKAADNYLSVFTGFAPSELDGTLSEALDKLDIYWSADKATTEDEPPIELKNNKFVSMFEVLTDMYGRPAYNEFDPTPFISIFFMLFFAFCMGDAGYGLILLVAGLALRKKMPKMAPLVMTLGAATVVVGFLFHTFFSIDISQWECIPQWMKAVMVPAKVGTYDGTMVLAILVGIVHLCIAMIVKTYNATKNHGFLGSLSTWGWTLLIVGGVITGGLALAGVIDSAVTKIVVIVLGCVSAAGIFLLNNLHRNPLINIGSGLWETYNTATGLLGDVLSYLRLYALGLAGSMLGFAFNDLAAGVLGDGHFGINWLFFILIVVIGHTLNLAMAALGAFVHPLRLNFLEFFKNSGYEGSGRSYRPLKKEQ